MSLRTSTTRVSTAVATGLTAGLLTGLVVLAPTSAQAADRVTTVTSMDGIAVLACKVPTDGGTKWRIRDRVRNQSDTVASATMTAYRNGNRTQRAWTSGDVRPHSTSRVGGLTIPRGKPGWTLLSTVTNGQAGNGDERPVGRIGRC